MSEFLACSYGSVCSGCENLLEPAHSQRARKENHLRVFWNLHVGPAAMPELEWITIDKGGLRDRVDLMIDQQTSQPRLGLYDRFRTGIVDLQGCPQLSADLEAWFQEFRRIRIPLRRGSVRLRVSPSGQRGVWLDLANVDVKTLLDEREILNQLRGQAIVEIGQRRKRLFERDGRLKLVDPMFEPWFETYLGDESAVPLFCSIGTFTQPGFRANRALIRVVREMTQDLAVGTVIEFGSGIGNFTLPLASVANEVHAFEVDTLALAGLRRALEEAPRLREHIHIHAGNFQGSREVNFRDVDLVFVDPPRSGLMKFLDPLEQLLSAERPPHFLYVSCFAESFAQDAARLVKMGYHPRRLSLVDQFPQSRHFEIVASFSRV